MAAGVYNRLLTLLLATKIKTRGNYNPQDLLLQTQPRAMRPRLNHSIPSWGPSAWEQEAVGHYKHNPCKVKVVGMVIRCQMEEKGRAVLRLPVPGTQERELTLAHAEAFRGLGALGCILRGCLLGVPHSLVIFSSSLATRQSSPMV